MLGTKENYPHPPTNTIFSLVSNKFLARVHTLVHDNQNTFNVVLGHVYKGGPRWRLREDMIISTCNYWAILDN